MIEFAEEEEIPHYGFARYTQQALEKVTEGARKHRVPELRRLAAGKLGHRGTHVDSAFYRLRREYMLAILAGLETDQVIADIMEQRAEFAVTAVNRDTTGRIYTLRADMAKVPPVTVTAHHDPQGRVQRVVTITGAPVLGEARVQAVRAVRAYRVEHESVLSVSGPVQTSYGLSYTIIATVDGEDIEAGYVFIADGDGGGYNDDLTITSGADQPGIDTRHEWYALLDAYQAGDLP
jgi:hypothetical protein